MANRILVNEGWEQRIRDKMGVNTPYLPDTVLQQPDIINVAEANIINLIPHYAELKNEEKTWLEAATVCECAILLCAGMAVRLPRQSQGPHAKYEIGVDWDRKKAELQEERNEYLAKIKPMSIHYHFGLSR